MNRRSLATVLALALALLLGVGSLAGSTIAWFTENVTSTDNRIQSGTLDVEMYYQHQEDGVSLADQLADVTKWKDVDAAADLFHIEKLHMPGAAEVVFLQVRNEGSLALKYQLGITALDTFIAQNVYGEDIYMTEHLQMGAWQLSEAEGDGRVSMDNFANRNVLLKMIEEHPEDMHSLEDYSAYAANAANGMKDIPATVILEEEKLEARSDESISAGLVAPGESSDIIALVLYLPLDVDNTANSRGEKNPEVAIGVHVLAGQADVELDAFGKDADGKGYDADANYHLSPSILKNEARVFSLPDDENPPEDTGI